MRDTVLYIAMSLDGYIAKSNHDVSWLIGDGSDENSMGTYPAFYQDIDTVVMGYSTYHQITTELSPDTWVYSDKKSYVLTHRTVEPSENIEFTSEDIGSLIARIKKQEGKNIWICGGANIANQLIDLGLIDIYKISIIPTILGGGIPLFSAKDKELRLKLIETSSSNGIAELVYRPSDK